MLEMPFRLFDLYRHGGTIIVTINAVVKANGEAVMGAGVALEAKNHQPDLPLALGNAIKRNGSQVYWWPQYRMITFPTKHDWAKPSPIELIEKSAHELAALLHVHPELLHVYMPRPGCKNGGLRWIDVEKLLNGVFVNELRLRVLMARPED